MADKNILKKAFPEAIRLSWEDIENLLWETFVSLRSSGYDPDVIIGVARGGLVPARILSDYMQNKYICTFQMGHWAEDRTLSEKPTIVFPLPEIDLSDKRVLVVDDVSDEGGTMQEVVHYLSQKVGDIKTAVLVNKADSKFKTDYCSRIMKQWRWVLFPWSKHEDFVAFTEKVLQLTGGIAIEDIVRILEEALSVDVMTQEIEKVLLDMKLAGEVAEGKNGIWTLI